MQGTSANNKASGQKELLISQKKAFILILLSIVIVSGIPWSTWVGYRLFWKARSTDSKYNIVAIVQTGPEKEALRTSFLAELLGLSRDDPQNLYGIDLTSAKNRLLNFPLIKEASFKRISPGTLYIDYTIRKPIAFLADVTNTAIDEEGVLIPFHPFFSPKKLPEIRLGVEKGMCIWGKPLIHTRLALALVTLSAFEPWLETEGGAILRIDVSKTDELSLGQRRLVVTLERKFIGDNEVSFVQKQTIVVAPEEIQESIERYRTFSKSEVFTASYVLDLRLPQVGFVSFERD